jgi:membrane peptidoglycan carboxypeptidase
VHRANVVGTMKELLKGVLSEGTGRSANIGRPAAGKTGTTSDYKDAWFIGYTPDLVAGAWVGNDNNNPMKKVTGGMLPAQIWRNFMQPALANEPVSDIPTDIPSPLPWQQDLTHSTTRGDTSFLPWLQEQQAENVDPLQPVDVAPVDAPLSQKKDVKLDKGFWDKLMR